MSEFLSFGAWVRHRRRALDLTQSALATQVGCSKDMIVKLEADARRPSRELAALLARRLLLAPGEAELFLRCARAQLAADQLPHPTASLPRVSATLERAPASPLGNLPAALTPLIGRARELADVAGLLGEGGARLVTITGPGGVGKTRLALEVAAALAARYAHGAWLVDLAALHAAEQVPPAIAQALGVSVQGHQPPLAALLASLRGRGLLLVLDNYEHLPDAAPLVAELLRGAADLAVLATSRTPLHVTGEHEYPLHPLAVPGALEQELGGGADALLARYGALELFEQRARAVRPEIRLGDASLAAAAEICMRLDGLPLAIELAAARARLLLPEQLLEQIAQGGELALLTGGQRDQPARQRTMRATIAWSYDLLSPAEQALLRALAVCAGGWSLELAGALSAGDGQPHGAWAADTLAALVDQSLVVPYEDAAGQRRYRMLELIRAYALEQLRERGEERGARYRHAAYLAAWAEQHPFEVDERATVLRIRGELPNLRAALGWSLAGEPAQAEPGLRILAMTWEYWANGFGSWHEGRQWAALGLAACGRRPPELLCAHAMNVAARLLPPDEVSPADALALLLRSCALARSCGDAALEAEALRHLGERLWALGRLSEARQALDDSLAVCQTLGDPHRARQTGWSLFVRARLGLLYGDTPPDTARLEEAGRMFVAASDLTGQSIVADIMAEIAERAGDTAARIRHLEHAIALLRESNAGVAPRNLEESLLAYLRGDHEGCLRLLRHYQAEAERDGAARDLCEALAIEAAAHLARGDTSAVAAAIWRAVALFERGALPPDLPSLPGLAQLGAAAARLAAERGDALRAAHVAGSLAEHLALMRLRYEYHLPAEPARWLAQAAQAARAALGEEAYQAARAAGRALPLLRALSAAAGDPESCSQRR